ncbi:DUF4174 domain-containing protein [Methylopila henanensis]|uniref:DUF4174 domain-containing protein n=1 Tax=Methylopila henanensis TaxID=873516 RepID=A0ABW4K941_9HYPH
MAGLLAAFAAATSLPAVAEGLEAFRGKARPVVVFAPAPDAPQALDQLKRLRSDREGLESRDMPVFVVGPKRVTTLAGGSAPATLDASGLRAAYGVAEDAFAVVLVGKDGGEKLRSGEPLEAAKLFELVDEMPMRQRETR